MYQSMFEDAFLEVLMQYAIFMVVIAAYGILVLWRVFEKAGQPGWAALIPFYNMYIFTQVVQRPKWWMLLYFLSIVPFVGSIAVLVILIMDYHRLSLSFGKEAGFTVGLIFLGIIFLSILAFGDVTYRRLDGAPAGTGGNSDLLDN